MAESQQHSLRYTLNLPPSTGAGSNFVIKCLRKYLFFGKLRMLVSFVSFYRVKKRPGCRLGRLQKKSFLVFLCKPLRAQSSLDGQAILFYGNRVGDRFFGSVAFCKQCLSIFWDYRPKQGVP